MDNLKKIKLNISTKEDVISVLDKNAINNHGFKSNGRKYKRVFSRKERKSVAVDEYGGKYFADNKNDYTKSLSITLPVSLIKIIDNERGKVTRSRFIRKIIEYSLDVEQY